jgi:hypothetical protein
VVPLSAGNPGLLIDDPAWTVNHVDEFAPDEGEIRWNQGDKELQVNWRSAPTYQGYYDDRLNVSQPEPVTVLGREGALFTYGGNDFAVMLPVKGVSFLELRGAVGDRAAFLALLATLKQVPAEQWYAAMPESIVTPAKEAAVAAELLDGVPRPPGFKASALSAGQTNDRYQFGAKVLGAVACGWIKDYNAARAAGDKEGMSRVSAALSASPEWKVTRELAQGGGYADVLAQYVQRVAKGQDVADAQQGLGCS